MSENISHRKIPVAMPTLLGNEKIYVCDCLDSNWISSNGKYIGLFEKMFAEYLGVKHAISCCNGTAALHLALLSLNIGAGDEVIVPTLSYVATANAVTYTGATPILADCEPDTWNIDVLRIEELITPRTKAIIPVPLYGHACDMAPIFDIARRHSLYVIEDAAEALGSRYRGQLCGSMADVSTFSFYGNKTITTGEGGMVVTNDDSIADKIKIFKGQGMDLAKRYWFPVIGYNYRMTNIEAAIGLAQLEKVEVFLEKRKLIAKWYRNALNDINGITLPVEKDYSEHSWWMYSILIEDDYGFTRDEVISLLAQYEVETRPFFYPMHIMPVYRTVNPKGLDVSSRISTQGINLPTYFDLKEKDVQFVAKVLAKRSRRF